MSRFSGLIGIVVLLTSWQCLFCIFLNSLGISKFVFVLTQLNKQKYFSSDAVKCDKLQIWPLNHEVLQTWSYLSHLWCYANTIRNQRYVLDKDTCLNYLYTVASSLFFCWDVLVICLILVSKLGITTFTSYIFKHFERIDFCLLSFKKYYGLRQKNDWK